MTVNGARPPAQARRRRALAAMPLAMVCFTLPYVAMFTTLRWFEPAGNDGWAALGYFVGLLFLGVGLVVVVIPVVVFSLGTRLDGATRDWSSGRAAMAFGGVGFAMGLVLAVVIAWLAHVSPVGTIINFAVPAAVGGLATRLLLPAALAHRWVSVLSWVLAAAPVAAAVALVFSVRSA